MSPTGCLLSPIVRRVVIWFRCVRVAVCMHVSHRAFAPLVDQRYRTTLLRRVGLAHAFGFEPQATWQTAAFWLSFVPGVFLHSLPVCCFIFRENSLVDKHPLPLPTPTPWHAVALV